MSGTKRGAAVWCGGLCALAALLAWSFGSPEGWQSEARAEPNAPKFTGSSNCQGCHGESAPKPKYDGDVQHTEFTAWASGKDPHFWAFGVAEADLDKEAGEKLRGLQMPEAAAIAKRLGIADPRASDRCLTCHATSRFSDAGGKRTALAKTDVVGGKSLREDGVSCEACHGPSEKWQKPHQEKAWAATQRKGLGSGKLWSDFGFADLRNVKVRANACISCHLQIDHNLLAAGHPHIKFELSVFGGYEWAHWSDKGAWFGTKAWAAGQAVSLRDAARQLGAHAAGGADAQQLQYSYFKMLGHALMARQLAAAVDAPVLGAIDAQLKAAQAAGSDAKKLAAPLGELEKLGEALADKVQAQAFDQALTEKLLAGVAAEGPASGGLDFRCAEQYFYSIFGLMRTLAADAKPADAAAKTKEVGALYAPLGSLPGKYKKADFVAVAQKLATVFPGGKALALPEGVGRPGPTVAATDPAPAVTPKSGSEPGPVVADTGDPKSASEPASKGKPPEAGMGELPDPNRQPLPDEEQGKLYIFCTWCGTKWFKEYNYCGRCGSKLSKEHLGDK